MFKRLIASLVCLTFSLSILQYANAQPFNVNQLPVPGTMVGESLPFSPLALKGLIVNPQKPLEFQFIVDTGKGPQDTASVKDQANQLVKYFLAGLTIPEGDLWVNLSPYEKNRMVPEALGQTDLGRDLLAQDYILKQLTASLIYPEKDLGKEFWSRVYAKAQQQFGTTNVPVNTFNKVWIIPDQAQVFENVNAAYVTKSTLKVMLDEDYLALFHHVTPAKAGIQNKNGLNTLGSQIVRQIILPEIEKEVNTGKNFAPLRQIYQALILAKWYKETIQNGLLDAVYTNKDKVAGVNLNDPTVKEQIYNRYLQAYKKGAFNYIKEGTTPDGQVMPRKYFSGGEVMVIHLDKSGRQADIHGDGAMISLTVALVAAGAAVVGYALFHGLKDKGVGKKEFSRVTVDDLIQQLRVAENKENFEEYNRISDLLHNMGHLEGAYRYLWVETKVAEGHFGVPGGYSFGGYDGLEWIEDSPAEGHFVKQLRSEPPKQTPDSAMLGKIAKIGFWYTIGNVAKISSLLNDENTNVHQVAQRALNNLALRLVRAKLNSNKIFLENAKVNDIIIGNGISNWIRNELGESGIEKVVQLMQKGKDFIVDFVPGENEGGMMAADGIRWGGSDVVPPSMSIVEKDSAMSPPTTQRKSDAAILEKLLQNRVVTVVADDGQEFEFYLMEGYRNDYGVDFNNYFRILVNRKGFEESYFSPIGPRGIAHIDVKGAHMDLSFESGESMVYRDVAFESKGRGIGYRGVGRTLLTLALGISKLKGYRSFLANDVTNPDAVKLYSGLGFREDSFAKSFSFNLETQPLPMIKIEKIQDQAMSTPTAPKQTPNKDAAMVVVNDLITDLNSPNKETRLRAAMDTHLIDLDLTSPEEKSLLEKNLIYRFSQENDPVVLRLLLISFFITKGGFNKKLPLIFVFNEDQIKTLKTSVQEMLPVSDYHRAIALLQSLVDTMTPTQDVGKGSISKQEFVRRMDAVFPRLNVNQELKNELEDALGEFQLRQRINPRGLIDKIIGSYKEEGKEGTSEVIYSLSNLFEQFPSTHPNYRTLSVLAVIRFLRALKGTSHILTQDEIAEILKIANNPNALVNEQIISTRNVIPPKPDLAMHANLNKHLENGGIDLNQINVLRNGKTVNVQFDPAQLKQLEQGGFEGFTPVIINITHIQSPFELLGINPAK